MYRRDQNKFRCRAKKLAKSFAAAFSVEMACIRIGSSAAQVTSSLTDSAIQHIAELHWTWISKELCSQFNHKQLQISFVCCQEDTASG
jgi:hypothetical protein